MSGHTLPNTLCPPQQKRGQRWLGTIMSTAACCNEIGRRTSRACDLGGNTHLGRVASSLSHLSEPNWAAFSACWGRSTKTRLARERSGVG
ncbi:hypothetical protein RSOLAG1IB_11972 [Rhizoctonia solani AG-1 IB]|uniref:Uncharacterized protein n=1 Tax=Thanatephorus cucumeris (strain AG1-IB / isolate 7/3/14) TaxID=1108050 RepID=A0A0B7FF37_THACB|nr:hypothetical protein RSOLAG1IB_11972 [Rhizoctonia solani AG-1 IB]